MIDISGYNILEFSKLSDDIFTYFKDNSGHYGLNANQVVGNIKERPIGGLLIDIYYTDYVPLQGERPSANFLDTTTITIELVLLGISMSSSSKSYGDLCDRTNVLSLVASKIEDYLYSKGYAVNISSINSFQSVRDSSIKSSDTLNNGCVINLTTTLFSKKQ